jgi:hypothetical protein
MAKLFPPVNRDMKISPQGDWMHLRGYIDFRERTAYFGPRGSGDDKFVIEPMIVVSAGPESGYQEGQVLLLPSWAITHGRNEASGNYLAKSSDVVGVLHVDQKCASST